MKRKTKKTRRLSLVSRKAKLSRAKKPKHPKLRWHDWKSDYRPLYPQADRREMFSLDSCLAQFILPRLEEFSRNPHAHPAKITMRRWKWILGEMIYGFEFWSDEWIFEDDKLYRRLMRESKGDIYNHPEVKRNKLRAKRGRMLFGEWFDALWT